MQRIGECSVSSTRHMESPLSFSEIDATLRNALGTGDAGVVLAVDVALCQGILHRASDIYFEPWPDGLALRYRLDGALCDVALLPARKKERLIARLKVLSKLPVYQKDTPLDGRIDADEARLGRSMRVSTVPTIHGEKAVVRVLDPEKSILNLDRLGFDERLVAGLRELIEAPQGTVLLTGPSSSGKTTTIYSLLQEILAPERRARHVITLEDPVEYQLSRATQMQIAPRAESGFETLFRSVLRQDPDVIVIGEMRDYDSARTAIQAGLTGHLVISTIHSGSAAGVFSRLLDMGVEPYLVASSLKGVLAQRLVRKNCPACTIAYDPDARLVSKYGLDNDSEVFSRGTGCAQCNGLGHRGRTAFGELLIVNEALSDSLLTRPKLSTLQQIAVESGMNTLLDAARRNVREGITTVEELQRVIAPEPSPARGTGE